MSYIPINPASLFDSPIFTGDPTAPTPSPGDNDNSLATTAFVASAIVAGGAFIDAPIDGSLYGRRNAGWTKAAPLASPGLTGNPTAPTPTAGDNGISIATTAFVTTALASGGGPPPATVPPLMDGAAAVGTTTKYAREDHVHPSDTSRAPLASPTFTGIPAAPTAVGGTSTTQLATTAFVQAAVSAGGTFIDAPSDGSLYGRLNAGWTKAAPLNSPVLTGTPAAPTAAPGTNTTQLATTAYATAADTALKAAIVGTASASMDTLGEIETYISANITPALGNKADIFSPTFTGDPKAPTPTAGDNDTSIATTAFVTSAITTAGATYQPLDADLTALAATSGTNTIYYRSAANTWSPVTMGGNMTFTAGVLNSTAGGGGGISDAPSDSKSYARNNANWVDIALTYQPLDADLTAIAALSGTNNIYYRSAADTWSSVTIGTGLTFSAGTLAATGGVTPAALTRTNDTNVTATLGGTPATALLQATSITLGWTGTLATGRGGLGLDASASNGVPLFATGVATMTGTTGTGNFARAADPAFTGTPTAPTATGGTNTTQLATTAFVTSAITTAAVPAPATVAPVIDGTATVGVATKYAREDHVHPLSYTAAALTKVDDTNVTLTLGGTPATALLKASSLTLGWTGTLSTTRGGLGLNAGASNGVPIFAAGSVTMTAAAALSKTDDTNVTMTLGGTPTTALLAATSMTLGWAGTLSTTRGGLGANNSAANGVPLFASGVATVTGTTGTGNIVRAADPVFTGNPTAPTPTAGDNDTSIATTAFVTTAVAAAPSILSSTWLAGANPGGSTIFVAPRALTITSLVGVVDTANGATATVSVVKAASGTALASGTVIHSGSFNANGTANTNQTLTLTTTTMASGDRLGLTSTGTFTNSIASITVTVN